jgi:hypothetical protein
MTLNYPVQLIGITGHSGVGKDTVTDHILETYINCYELSFAAALKAGCSEIFGVDLGDFYMSERKEESNSFWNASPRKIAQYVGSEFFRDRIAQLIPWIGQDFWVQRMIGTLNRKLNWPGEYERSELDPEDTVIIPDVRFQNEYNFITSNGGIVIELQRAGCEGNVGIIGHQSERGVQSYTHPERTYTIYNDSTIEDLQRKIDELIEASPFIQLYTPEE